MYVYIYIISQGNFDHQPSLLW